MFEVKTFKKEYIDDCAKLFATSFNALRNENILIPEKTDVINETTTFLEEKRSNPGFVVFKNNKLVGYMLEAFRCEFMGYKTAFSNEHGSNCAVSEDKELIYQKLYEQLARIWIDNDYFAHQITLFAHDKVLTNCLLRLGFGMTHFELMRDLKPINDFDKKINIQKLENDSIIRPLQKEFHDFFIKPPLFWRVHKPYNENHKDEIAAGKNEGYVAFDNDKPVGYFILRKGKAESWLFSDKKNGQIKEAFIKPEYRFTGYGKALFQMSVNWAQENSLKRLYVEGESANICGGNFWMKHFLPISFSVRRVVDKYVNIS
jgi:GNAT superfamily N-acetyltransferase